jgi:hypothetical protein
MSVGFKYNDSYAWPIIERCISPGTSPHVANLRQIQDNPRPGLKTHWEIRQKAKKGKSN